jgi:hypothetical protein
MAVDITGFNRRRRELAARKAAEEKARKGDYAAMTVVELKEYAAGMGIDVPARAKKNDIIIAIMETEVV